MTRASVPHSHTRSRLKTDLAFRYQTTETSAPLERPHRREECSASSRCRKMILGTLDSLNVPDLSTGSSHRQQSLFGCRAKPYGEAEHRTVRIIVFSSSLWHVRLH